MKSAIHALLALTLAAQDQPTRQIFDTTLKAKRPQASGKPAPKPAAPPKGSQVGVTLWNMRPSRPQDTREIRMLVHQDGGAGVELTPERIAADTPLQVGQRVRISVESAAPGHLYIIDREVYADGTASKPMLIFPTTRLRGGNGFVKAGVLVEIPEPGNGVYTIERKRKDQVSEKLTILVSPAPIAELKITSEAQELDEAKVALWEKQWQAKTFKSEAKELEGKVYTVEEMQAASGAKLLTSDGPAPQTMYQIDNRPGKPVLLHVPLRIKP